MGIFIMNKNLFFYEKHGRVFEYLVPNGYKFNVHDTVSKEMLDNFTLLRQCDAFDFYNDTNRLNTFTELYVDQHDPIVMEQADANALERFKSIYPDVSFDNII